VKQYGEVRAAVDRSLDQLATSEAARLARKWVSGPALEAARNTPEQGPRIIANRLAAMADFFERGGDARTAKQIRAVAAEIVTKAAKVDKLKKHGYAPLMRFGQYTVYVTRDFGKEQVFFGMYESQRQANKAAEALRSEYPTRK
jgi:hypothetical protein